jgi:hypothetical protein
MLIAALSRLRYLARRSATAARTRLARWTRPAPLVFALGAAADATRSHSELLLENALLRHQLVVYRRGASRPQLTTADRAFLVLRARRLRTWAGALVIVRPETVLRWHRQGFRLFWRRTSRAVTRTAPTARDERSDRAEGTQEPALGSRSHPWGVVEDRHPRE